MAERNEIAKTEASEYPPLPLVALSPAELATAQDALKQWCNRKIDEIKEDLVALNDAYAEAKKRKWKVAGWANQIDLGEQRMRFYGKVRLAVDHGYLIVPDFPITVFAVRTAAEEIQRHGYWFKPRLNDKNAADVEPQLAESGAGRYVAPTPRVTWKGSREYGRYPNGEKDMRDYFEGVGFREWQFPVRLAQPKIIEATRQAMALRVFDEVGLVGPERKADPMIIGRILDPRHNIFYRRGLSFFIAWWMRWEDL